nr:toxin-antitoxin system, antitoxin component, Xre family protein [uncultured Fusobacterium sp.]
MIETELLKEKIKESGYRFSWIAKQLNLSSFGMRKKINGENEFKVSEVKKISKLLNLNEKEREKIFF